VAEVLHSSFHMFLNDMMMMPSVMFLMSEKRLTALYLDVLGLLFFSFTGDYLGSFSALGGLMPAMQLHWNSLARGVVNSTAQTFSTIVEMFSGIVAFVLISHFPLGMLNQIACIVALVCYEMCLLACLPVVLLVCLPVKKFKRVMSCIAYDELDMVGTTF